MSPQNYRSLRRLDDWDGLVASRSDERMFEDLVAEFFPEGIDW